MIALTIIVSCLLSTLQTTIFTFCSRTDERTNEVSAFLREFNHTATLLHRRATQAHWNYVTNMNPENMQRMLKAELDQTEYYLEQSVVALKLQRPGLSAAQQRQLKFILAYSAVSEDKNVRKHLAGVTSNLSAIFNTAQVVLQDGTSLGVSQAGIVEFFKTETDYDALAFVWKKWRDVTGRKMKTLFVELVQLMNEGAKKYGNEDIGHFQWYMDYEDPEFNEKIVGLMTEIRDLYQELHAFVRFKLSKKYPSRFDSEGPIPAHILGNPWAQSWMGTYALVAPFPSVSSPDITPNLKAQNWTVLRMFRTAEAFFASMGLPRMTEKFWDRSILEDPGSGRFDCQGNAWDFFTHDDFRIKMCTQLDHDYFIKTHHEMGHIQYFMHYAHLPILFRFSANSGFHEAVGDTIALSTCSSRHLQKIGLLENSKEPAKAQLNALMLMALHKVAFLPFALAVTSWQWRVLNGSVSADHFNAEWWRLRRDLQGLMPPVQRSESDFDPGAKFHVAHAVPYTRYFTSTVLQFQFFEALCRASGHVGALHRCDFSNSRAAGQLLSKMMSFGASKHWSDTLEVMTGQRKMDIGPLRRYFAPLHRWLRHQRAKMNYPIGW